MTKRHALLLLLLSAPFVAVAGCGSGTQNPDTKAAGGAGGSSSASTSSKGGAGGSSAQGGSTAAKCITIADDLIADFKTDNGLNPVDGREGGFYLYGDGSLKGAFDPPLETGSAYPIDSATGNDLCSGKGSFHTKATGWGVWGAALGVDFKPKISGEKGTYDASKYKGISFWAKSAAPLTRVQVSFPDIYTDGDADPSVIDPAFSSCVYAPAAPTQNCSPYLVKFGEGKYMDSQIDTTWKRFDVLFEDTVQDQYNKGFHTEADKLDTKHLTAMAIQVNANFSTTPVSPNDFEIWVDDINFIK
jgi:hypothetical protein